MLEPGDGVGDESRPPIPAHADVRRQVGRIDGASEPNVQPHAPSSYRTSRGPRA